MRRTRIILAGVSVLFVIGTALLLSLMPGGPPEPAAGGERGSDAASPLRIGLIPERDVFAQRRRYQALAAHLSTRMGRRVELATVSSYRGILDDLEERRIDVAFLGSLTAVLAMDRYGARVAVKPVMSGGVATYRGVIFVRDDAPAQRVGDLAGGSIAMVRTTLAGELFGLTELSRAGLAGTKRAPVIHWVGTHDTVVREVADGRVIAGAAKDLRLEAYEAVHPGTRFRRLAVSDAVPNNALVARADLPEGLLDRIVTTLLAMRSNDEGRRTLVAFGAERFEPCRAEEYAAVRSMMAVLSKETDGRWSSVDEIEAATAEPAAPPESAAPALRER